MKAVDEYGYPEDWINKIRRWRRRTMYLPFGHTRWWQIHVRKDRGGALFWGHFRWSPSSQFVSVSLLGSWNTWSLSMRETEEPSPGCCCESREHVRTDYPNTNPKGPQ